MTDARIDRQLLINEIARIIYETEFDDIYDNLSSDAIERDLYRNCAVNILRHLKSNPYHRDLKAILKIV